MTIESAMVFAVEAHGGQFRDGAAPLPYASHAIEVASILRYVGGVMDEGMISAALLHDVLEETSTTAERVEELFGIRVRELVESVTRNEPTDEEVAGLTELQISKLRSEMLLDEIRLMSPESQTIKLADRLSNVRAALATRAGKKLERYLDQTREILMIIPEKTNPALHKAVRKAAGLKRSDLT